MIFHIKMGMIDRGADVAFASQFPLEKEILFAPLTGMEVVSAPWVEGSTPVLDVRLNCNYVDRTSTVARTPEPCIPLLRL